MAEVKLIEAGDTADSPSQVIVKAAAKTSSHTDALGRVIRVRRLGPVDRMRLFRLLGSEDSGNSAYLSYALMAASVTAIDGEAFGAPASRKEIEALIQRLDDEGLAAIGVALSKISPDVRAALVKAGQIEDDGEGANEDVTLAAKN
jgi:hypothetical protein